MSKFEEKEKAIKLRKQGFSYSEILKEIPVAKSTLSLWLRSVGLSQKQKQKLTKKKLAAALRGAQARRDHRLAITKEIKDKAIRDIGEISDRELWLIGAALYWAEGSKEKNKSSALEFCNSDALMIKLFMRWIARFMMVLPERIKFELFIHENHKHRLPQVKKHWVDATGMPFEKFNTVYFKKHKPKTNRKNISDNYFGVLKVKVSKSSSLNRQVTGWIEGICKHCGVV
ncbi:MAG: hypothetical protein WC919_02530 [Candidatus Paceibacterota bacterium]